MRQFTKIRTQSQKIKSINYTFRFPLMNNIYIIALFLGLSLQMTAQDDSLSSQNNNRHQIVASTDNDFFAVFTNKDRSYSFGVSAGYRFIPNKENLFTRIFSDKKDFLHFINLKLEAYTPNYNFNTGETTGIRPFAGWSYATIGTTYTFDKSIITFKTEIGVLGEISQAHELQDWFHSKVSGDVVLQGWDQQVPNQLGVNLKANYTRSIFTNNGFNGFVEGNASLGNVRTLVNPQLGIRFGKFLEIRRSSAFQNSLFNTKDEVEYFIKLTGGFKLKAYDATLQGNMFGSNKNDYILEDIDHTTFHASLGGFVHFRDFDFSAIYYINSGEIDSIRTHSYGAISIAYQF